ncbi:MAG TPA: MIP/aquaporin family protein [Limnobacter sp.]|uniref:MIP/aquaporin family protein n=1 Tax=Limnobacter sp. TaxID=2003368 RepID=UPI002E36C6DD|nr:MIP/aquaporin family protein [Limnobacter sp.]HEX5485693.1 MIP/aquaporin family protein [Limnobacter sp.]
MQHSLRVRLLAEFAGTALLLCVVIGSGIMGTTLSQGNDAIALLANTLATVFGLYFLIEVFGDVSGAHFNPAVTLGMVMLKRQAITELFPYWFAQLSGAAAGAWVANGMFGLSIIEWSTKLRTGPGIWTGEIVATAGLLMVILMSKPQKVSSTVAAFIGAAYWFTSSTSFANPAAVFGRMFSNTFAGIQPGNAPAFVVAQTMGLLLGVGAYKLLIRRAK